MPAGHGGGSYLALHSLGGGGGVPQGFSVRTAGLQDLWSDVGRRPDWRTSKWGSQVILQLICVEQEN